uniref:Protein FAM76B n=1 Tax=Caenorhabditis tropicalis TaxID=1561998 RepID=A0A1I7UXM7_9PELO
MPAPLLKKCFNCRMFLTEDAVNLSQCLKCQKNEAKYGKPGTCEYCKLNAAFHDQKCVWCSHAERKFGSPFTCFNCKLRCAFPRRECDKMEGAALLCRLCILQARQTNQTMVAGIPVPPEKPERSGEGSSSEHRDRDRDRRNNQSSSSHQQKDNNRREDRRQRDRESSRRSGQKRRHPDETNNNSSNGASSSGVPPLLPNNENGHGFPPFAERDHGESMVKQQKMEDEIRRLKSLVQEKEMQIFDKDRQISTLKAEQYNIEKKHRERVQQLIKEKEDSIRAIEHMRSSKSSKKN